jgi:hypothetical protein
VDGGSAGQSETWHRIVGEIAAAVARVDPAALTRLVGVLAPSSRQLGGSLFEQTALIVLDGALCRVAAGDPDAADRLRALHANLH